MASNTYTAVAANQHNITVYDASSGNYVSSINVTSGQIIGQPIVSANTITVTTILGIRYGLKKSLKRAF